MTPLVRWTIGPVSKAGFDCLALSLRNFLNLYDVEPVVCFNCDKALLQPLLAEFPGLRLYDQSIHRDSEVRPEGVSWKLYPPRLEQQRHELSIDNDIIITERVPFIDRFFAEDCTLMLQDRTRTYGRFERHVPAGYCINSGLYGMPPNFNLEGFIRFFAKGQWEINALGGYQASRTFDEQGLIALSLLNNPRFLIIPQTEITNCEYQFVPGKGMHFIGLNRNEKHLPYRLYKSTTRRMFL